MPIRVRLVGSRDVDAPGDEARADEQSAIIVVAGLHGGARAELLLEEHVTVGELVSRVRAAEREQPASDRARPPRSRPGLEALGLRAAESAHDLGNFIAMFELSLHALEREPLGDGALVVVAELRQTASRALRLIRHMLDQVRGRESQRVTLALGDLVHGAMQVLRAALPPGVGLRVDVAPDVPEIEGIPIELEQLVLNLVVNARNAMPQGGALGVSVARRGERVELEVWDTGTGWVAPPRAASTERLHEGTGLGLGIVRGVAIRHDATVQLLPRDGGGARVVVSFPARRIEP